ncbi:MAG: DUF4831 family protein [Bacteroidales bacterium]|nr:DUF4831 family protein [Bacteroidales bacterium]MDE7465162.1 DUF4831 family protein [Muribaculaceae bacterium]
MRVFKKILAGLALMVSLGAQQAPAQQTRILTADKHNEYGLVYRLPKTALRIEVTATRTRRKAGPFWQYAKKYIGTDQVIREDSEEWTLNSVSVAPYGVADDETEYLMQLKPGSVAYISVDADGMIGAINKEIPSAPAIETATARPENADRPLDVNRYLQYVNDEFLASQSSGKKAQLLTENIMEVRDAKVSLSRGTAETMPTDGRQLELMLNSLADQEASMTAAFRGLEDTATFTMTYTYLPADNGREVLFRLSDFAGFVDADDLSGAPVYISVEITRQGELPVDVKGEEKKLPKDAVIYNIPGAARVTVSHNGRNYFEREFEFAQFGVKFGLNPTLFSDKKAKSFAVFSPVTGALTEIGETE